MNKCRIYTLTFHAADNYGAVWQAYALQQFLIANKIDTACIDYHPRYFNDSLFALSPGPVSTKKILQSIITFPTRLKRKCSFYQFRRQFLKLTSVNNVDLSRATIIVGSDQIWNKSITGGHLDVFFLLHSVKCDRKYSYAASIGEDTVQNIGEVYGRLNDFVGIGVREKNVYDQLSKKNDQRIVWNSDPVFLLNSSDYPLLPSRYPGKKIVLIYTLETNMDVCHIIEKYRSTHLVISIGSFRNIYHSDIHYRAASPLDFLSLIAHADIVVSNSFHTIAFSIIFNRTIVYVPLKNGRGSRIRTLLSLLGCHDNYCEINKCDKSRLDLLVKDSKVYLQKIIKEQNDN